MTYNYLDKQFNIITRNLYGRNYNNANRIAFTSSAKDEFIPQKKKVNRKLMYDNGTNMNNAIENVAEHMYKIKYEPPIALSNMLYHNMGNLGFWRLTDDTEQLKGDTEKAKEQFPEEKLIPFAKSAKDKRIAYFDILTSKVIVKEGDKETEDFSNFNEWFYSNIEHLLNSQDYLNGNEDEIQSLEGYINSNSVNKFKCPNGYKQARTLNLIQLYEGWIMPEIMKTDLINYSSQEIIPFACSESGNTFAAFVNKGNENPGIIVGTILPGNRLNYAKTKSSSYITIIEQYKSFEDWFKNQIKNMLYSDSY